MPLMLLLCRYPKELNKIMHVIHRAAYLKKQAKTEAVTYILRFRPLLKFRIF